MSHYQYTIKATMPAVSQFLIKNLLSQFNNHEKMENAGEDASDKRGLAVVLTMALFALFLATTSYYQCWPFNHSGPSLIPSYFVRACPPPPSTLIVNHTNIFSASQYITASSQNSPPKPLNYYSVRRFG